MNKNIDQAAPEQVPADLEYQIIRTVASHLGIPRSELKPDSHLHDELGADLVDMIELAVTVEEQFDIRLPLDDPTKVQRLDDLVNLVRSALRKRPWAPKTTSTPTRDAIQNNAKED